MHFTDSPFSDPCIEAAKSLMRFGLLLGLRMKRVLSLADVLQAAPAICGTLALTRTESTIAEGTFTPTCLKLLPAIHLASHLPQAAQPAACCTQRELQVKMRPFQRPAMKPAGSTLFWALKYRPASHEVDQKEK